MRKQLSSIKMQAVRITGKGLWIILLILYSVNLFAQSHSPNDSIAIGLLISDNTYQDAKHGAQLAVMEANRQNYLNGKKVKLITRSMEGPWGTGAKQTVDLVFNQKVWAIVGSHDGRNSHLAEQVIAKTQIVYISAWSGDPTLAQAYVPWFFSMVPNNIQQAQSLCSELYSSGNPGKIVLVTDDTYDSENELKYFMAELKQYSKTDPVKLSYEIRDFQKEKLLAQIQNINPDVLVLLGRSQESVSLIKSLQDNSVHAKIITSFETLGETPGQAFSVDNYKGTIIPNMNYLNSQDEQNFIKGFESEFHVNASPTAAYTYDAVWLLLKKIKESGYNRETFKTLMQNTNEEGLTGIIQFDSLGNRKQKVNWIQIK